MRQVDLVVLCLPDEAAKEAVALIDSLGANSPKIVDGSTAHRIAPGWVYGFPEMDAGQTEAVREARRVSNPGCYPTAAIALIRPLVEAGLLPADYPVTVNAVSGYSGGGRSMIEAYEKDQAPAFELYGLGFEHKHLPELQAFSKLTRRPIFVPSVGNYRQGMLVSVPLHLDTLPGKPKARDLEAALARHYAGAELVKVVPAGDRAEQGQAARARGAQRHRPSGAARLRQRRNTPSRARRPPRQPGQGRVRRRRAEHRPDAGRGDLTNLPQPSTPIRAAEMLDMRFGAA
jgi:N-acetyl-gamma-glutamyl-phosphate reductase